MLTNNSSITPKHQPSQQQQQNDDICNHKTSQKDHFFTNEILDNTHQEFENDSPILFAPPQPKAKVIEYENYNFGEMKSKSNSINTFNNPKKNFKKKGSDSDNTNNFTMKPQKGNNLMEEENIQNQNINSNYLNNQNINGYNLNNYNKINYNNDAN